MSYEVAHTGKSATRPALASLEALLRHGDNGRYSDFEREHAIVTLLVAESREWNPDEVPEKLRELFATFAIAAGAHPGMTPDETHACLAAFLAKHPARPDLLREISEAVLATEEEQREASLAVALQAISAPAVRRATAIGPRVASSVFAMQDLHAAVGVPFR